MSKDRLQGQWASSSPTTPGFILPTARRESSKSSANASKQLACAQRAPQRRLPSTGRSFSTVDKTWYKVTTKCRTAGALKMSDRPFWLPQVELIIRQTIYGCQGEARYVRFTKNLTIHPFLFLLLPFTSHCMCQSVLTFNRWKWQFLYLLVEVIRAVHRFKCICTIRWATHTCMRCSEWASL